MMETKIAAFLWVKAYKSMTGAPVFTPFIKIDLTSINRMGESSNRLISGFTEDWLFGEKAQDCAITNRNLEVEIYHATAEFATTTTITLPPALCLKKHC